MSNSDIYKNSFKNIKKYIDDMYYKAVKNISGLMKKSDYDKNNNGIVDNSEKVVLTSQSAQVTDTTIRFGVDPDGKWGYIKEGADTVTPFKSGGGEMQSKIVHPSETEQIVEPDEGYDGLSDVTVEAITLQSKTASPTTSQQILEPDTGYDGLSDVTVEAITLQSKTVSPSSSQQIVEADSQYTGLSQVTVNAITGNKYLGRFEADGTYENLDVGGYATCSFVVSVPFNLQAKTQDVTFPVSSWSSSLTGYVTIEPDQGVDGLSRVEVRTEFLSDNTLIDATGVVTPSVYYDKGTAVSNSDKMLRVRPGIDGYGKSNSDWVVKANSYFGDAQPSDVRQGKIFSSSYGIQQTGKSTAVEPSGEINLGTFRSNGTYTRQSVAGYATCAFIIDVSNTPTGQLSKNINEGILARSTNDYNDISELDTYETIDVSQYATIRLYFYRRDQNSTILWKNTSASSAMAANTVLNLSQNYQNFDRIRIVFVSHRNLVSATPTKTQLDNYGICWEMPVDTIININNTSTNLFYLASRAQSSAGQTNGSSYGRAFRFSSTTAITVGNAVPIQGSGGSTANNTSAMIPIYVMGLKRLSTTVTDH